MWLILSAILLSAIATNVNLYWGRGHP